MEIEHEMWRILDRRGAEYPAEHNVGHVYDAKPPLVESLPIARPQQQLQSGHRAHVEARSLEMTTPARRP
jgi:D-lactate dehydrogenase (quinone)